MRDVFQIRKYKTKDGIEKTDWIRCGFSFGENKDGSINFELYMFPDVQFHIRERKETQSAQGLPF